jgi:isopropylmalate/homocitrate/citramalate synthase
MKQTAVEFLVKKIKPLYIGNFEMTFLKEIEQAKEIEKQQQVYNKEIVYILDNVRYWETCPDNYKVIIEKFIEQFKNK